MSGIELVVTDLDGTLWDEREAVHDRTADAWRELERRAVPVMVATGRRLGSTKVPLARYGFAPPAVLMNGALGQHLGNGTRFHRHHFDAADAAGALAAFRSVDLEPCVYVEHDELEVFLGSNPSTHPEHVRAFGAHAATSDLEAVVGAEPVFMFGMLGQDEARLRSIATALARVGEAHLAPDPQFGGYGITLVPRGLSKWLGVTAYCTEARIDASRVLAIGDGPNDLELLGGAAIAVVPDGGCADAVALAHHVVARPHDGGWAEILDLV